MPQQRCPVGAVCECEEAADNAGINICTLNKQKVKLDGEAVDHIGSWVLDQQTGIYELVSCPPGTEIAKEFNTVVDGKTELIYQPERQECRPCKDGEEYVLVPNKYRDAETRDLKYHTCQDCPVQPSSTRLSSTNAVQATVAMTLCRYVTIATKHMMQCCPQSEFLMVPSFVGWSELQEWCVLEGTDSWFGVEGRSGNGHNHPPRVPQGLPACSYWL